MTNNANANSAVAGDCASLAARSIPLPPPQGLARYPVPQGTNALPQRPTGYWDVDLVFHPLTNSLPPWENRPLWLEDEAWQRLHDRFPEFSDPMGENGGS